MSEDISLFDLLNLSIGTPQRGFVNFDALHQLLLCVLKELGLQEKRILFCRNSPPGHGQHDAPPPLTDPVEAAEEERSPVQGDISAVKQEAQPGSKRQERTASLASPPVVRGSPEDDLPRLRSRVQSCEAGVTEAMKLIQELQQHTDHLKVGGAQVDRAQVGGVQVGGDQVGGAQVDGAQVDGAQVDWAQVDGAQVGGDQVGGVEVGGVQVGGAQVGGAEVGGVQVGGAQVGGAEVGGVQVGGAQVGGAEVGGVQVGGAQVGGAQVGGVQVGGAQVSGAQVDKARVGGAQVGRAQVDRAQVGAAQVGRAQMKAETAVEKCSHRVNALEEVVRSLRASCRKSLDPNHPGRFMTWEDMESALRVKRHKPQQELVNSGVIDPDGVSGPSPPPGVTGPSPPPGVTGPSPSPSTSPLTSPSPPPQPDQHSVSPAGSPVSPAGSPTSLGDESSGATETPSDLPGTPLQADAARPQRTEDLTNIGKLRDRLELLEGRVTALVEVKLERTEVEQLRELVKSTGSQENELKEELHQQRAPIKDLSSNMEKSVHLVNNVQKAIHQLQSDCEKLQESTRSLHDDSRQNQNHIKELLNVTEQLEVKKADKQMVESEIKADKSALETKVSRLQFDLATEQLTSMFHELLSKVSGQEQDWQNIVDRLSTEMERKLNRIELDSMKKQLEDRWKSIRKKLKAQQAPDHDDGAGLKKQLVDRFHCLSCDRPVVKQIPGPQTLTLPSTPAFPAHKSIRPFTVYALEQFRQHYRSERLSELTDCSYSAGWRSCGGSHTYTLPGQRRSGLQYVKQHIQVEVEGGVQSEEVDIVGLDGQIYKGRLNVPSVRTSETKLPTISTKDGPSRTKDKARCSPSLRPVVSPEVGHNTPTHLQAKSSHSASSTSPLRPVTPAAENNMEPPGDEQNDK
ncbi:ribosome-binding protein 1-like [Embiotoca jacksoni]|uniref:ribosome-binding protein 1-like n=1 Tax=Embiotoca jacksoni TaxID=100190 RepID=UPI00370452A9